LVREGWMGGWGEVGWVGMGLGDTKFRVWAGVKGEGGVWIQVKMPAI
jgi:hypothetical protein